MADWRHAILQEFIPQVSKLTLVSDPDSLLTEEKLANELRRKGFDLIEFIDPVEFRYAYESKYRSIWDRGEHTDLVVVLRFEDSEIEKLPYDLLATGRRLSFSISSIFPNLSCPVIESLDRGVFDRVYEAQIKAQPERLGDNATRDFVLRHVYGVAAEIINNDVDLLRALLRIHYTGTCVPGLLAERLIKVLSANDAFSDWPLARIIPDSGAFFAFLQERWPIFLAACGDKHLVMDKLVLDPLKFNGPEHIPFDHQDIKVYIDNLFVEGRLLPVKDPGLGIDDSSWLRCGVVYTHEDDEEIRINRLLDLVAKKLPASDARHQEWLSFAMSWAELSALMAEKKGTDQFDRFRLLSEKVDSGFSFWLQENYAGLINLPSTKPVMVHHIAKYLAHTATSDPQRKVALIVLDGASLDQWVTIRNYLKESDKLLTIRDEAVFAWVPTLTSVSRQAIFAGKPPIYFPTSIDTTNAENNLWWQFWDKYGVAKPDVVYRKGLGDENSPQIIDDLINPAKTKAIGLVVDKIDRIMHGMQLGAAGMHNQIRLWCRDDCLINLIDKLLGYGFDLWLTSDHGNRESRGIGIPAEGAVAELRGERVRVYDSEELRDQFAAKFPTAKKWMPTGLPENYLPLIAAANDAFVQKGSVIVGHGGTTIEEVLVPLVKIEKEKLNEKQI